MGIRIYQCSLPGQIKTITPDEYAWDYSPAQFCVVERYGSLYGKALPRFGEDTPYALPGKNKSIRPYKGIDREPSDHTPEDMDLYSAQEVLDYFRRLDDGNTELIYYRMAGYDSKLPEGLAFLGFDVGYLFGKGNGDGFSVICDCMFLCRWHGCDKEGTEFRKEFRQLNKNGLFDTEDQAVGYLYHYLDQGWAEIGDFCVFEIFEPA